MRAFIITMVNEVEVVRKTIQEIRSKIADAYIVVVQSGESHGPVGSDEFSNQTNLAETTKRYELAARAITRNYAVGFSLLYSSHPHPEYIVALTGDTLVTDANNFDRRHNEMLKMKKVLACSQAIGQNFHAADSDPENGMTGGRFQYYGISDFMPQMFIVDGRFALRRLPFVSIELTNPFTSEQCLGDEFMKHITDKFRDSAYVLSDNAYQYSDGIIFHAKG